MTVPQGAKKCFYKSTVGKLSVSNQWQEGWCKYVLLRNWGGGGGAGSDDPDKKGMPMLSVLLGGANWDFGLT